MRTDVVRAASPSWNMVLRRTEEQQFYMELTPLLFYFGAMVLRQAKCNSVCSSETVHSVQEFLNKLSKMELNDFKLYTPTLSNYGNCSKSTMTCFEKEMTVLVHETEQNSNLPTRLKKLTRYLSDKTHPCPQCEVYKEEKAEIFLNTLLHILQIMCSINNTVTKSESK
ncbi:interleukin 15, like isoform X2 [Neoarius graeffei]|uniref:interleukin 15, like isoform X2 n=1 Tax=Neoarius graeffei TaxID=443677 RepID=UPI00298C03EA|nr:interleukin 15, like isoform X2 [Neoarius graeffei]